jgi:hypothetical protein
MRPNTQASSIDRKSAHVWRFALALLCCLFVCGGANCRQWTRQYTDGPRTLPVSATLDQVVASVNDNASRVQSLQSTQASLTLPGAPIALRASVALQEPRRLRLTANSPFNSELDLGSNDEIFWLWVRQQQPQATFFCRHDQFAVSNARQIMPVEPEWLIAAVGLPRFDETQPIEGPTPVGNGRLQLRSKQPSSLGDMTKLTIIDEWDGTVQEQHLYDPQGKLLASALTSRYKRDPASGAALPRSIDIRWPTTGLSFHLDVSDWQVNSIAPENLSLFTKPEYPGYPDTNLADPNLQFFQPGNPPQQLPPSLAAPVVAPSAAPIAPTPIMAPPPTMITPAAAGRISPR